MSPLRVAVVGAGYLGRFHAEKYRALERMAPADGVERELVLVGVCDIDADKGRQLASELDTEFFAEHRALAGRVDAVTIAASTPAHFELARYFLEHDVHVLVEKPMTRTSREAAELTELAERRGLKLQVGHIERFNPALLAARKSLTTVQFIECHRLAPFNVRGTDVNVVLDLMIHDLDVILSLVDAPPVEVSAVGLSVLTEHVDIANARIEFANRAIANVTASRASTTTQRKFRVFQRNQYLGIDFGNRELRRVTSRPGAAPDESPLEQEQWSLDHGDALLAETRAFVEAIRHDTPCAVSGRDGLAALELAERIIEAIEQRAGGALSWG